MLMWCVMCEGVMYDGVMCDGVMCANVRSVDVVLCGCMQPTLQHS